MTNVNDAWIGNLVRHWREDPGASYQTMDGQGFP
jgi:type II restriction enzyme